jgi:hypothetical protein
MGLVVVTRIFQMLAGSSTEAFAGGRSLDRLATLDSTHVISAGSNHKPLDRPECASKLLWTTEIAND